MADRGDAGDAFDLTELSLEQLLSLQVRSAAKRDQELFETAAAVFVLTGEDIRRSGATSIADALRLVPGLEVARFDGTTWAITARGFNGRVANKLLVLIDGRSVYSPLFSGVFWDVQDTLLEDVDRIEVIRGPGASVWGANAVNGIINILTKPSAETQGGKLVLAGGDEERGTAAVRYGGALGDSGHYRVYAKWLERDSLAALGGIPDADGSESGRFGFRTDWQRGGDWLLSGEVYDSESGLSAPVPRLTPPFTTIEAIDQEASGGHLLGRYTRGLGSGEIELQLYADFTDRFIEELVDEDRETYDFELVHRHARGRHELVWGFGFRHTRDRVVGSGIFVRVDEPERADDLWSAFVQDELGFAGGRFLLTFGSKLEHNDYTGFELQPTLRGLYKLSGSSSLWAAVSRAVRTPTRADYTFRTALAVMPPGPGSGLPLVIETRGRESFDSEELLAYELGFRSSINDRVYLDLALFYNDYDSLQSFTLGPPELELQPPPPHLITPLVIGNDLTGSGAGLEGHLAVDLRDGWRLDLTYSFLDLDFSRTDLGTLDFEALSPEHRLGLHSRANLGEAWDFDVSAYWVDALPASPTGAPAGVDDYLRLDLRLEWRPRPELALALVVQNATDDVHQEFDSREYVVASGVERSVYGKLTWDF